VDALCEEDCFRIAGRYFWKVIPVNRNPVDLKTALRASTVIRRHVKKMPLYISRQSMSSQSIRKFGIMDTYEIQDDILNLVRKVEDVDAVAFGGLRAILIGP
jgi:hypothetical protein